MLCGDNVWAGPVQGKKENVRENKWRKNDTIFLGVDGDLQPSEANRPVRNLLAYSSTDMIWNADKEARQPYEPGWLTVLTSSDMHMLEGARLL